MAKLADVNKAWDAACRTVFGGELGPIEDYADYLQKHIEFGRPAKSAISAVSAGCVVSSSYAKTLPTWNINGQSTKNKMGSFLATFRYY